MLEILEHFERITFHCSAAWFHQAGPCIPTYNESISTLEDLQFTALSRSASKCCTTMRKKEKSTKNSEKAFELKAGTEKEKKAKCKKVK